MKTLDMFILKGYLKAQSKMEKFLNDESGEVNMIAIVLIIIVVIGLIAVFRDGIKGLLDSLFEKAKGATSSI